MTNTVTLHSNTSGYITNAGSLYSHTCKFIMQTRSLHSHACEFIKNTGSLPSNTCDFVTIFGVNTRICANLCNEFLSLLMTNMGGQCQCMAKRSGSVVKKTENGREFLYFKTLFTNSLDTGSHSQIKLQTFILMLLTKIHTRRYVVVHKGRVE